MEAGAVAFPRPGPVGIFGGTFDPVHNAHLRVALDALETLGLAEVRFIPSARPPHRPQPGAAAAERLALLRAATADQPGFSVDPLELERAGPSYMIDTLSALRVALPDRPLCLLLGADAFHGLPTWQRWRELLNLAHLVVLSRPGATATDPDGPLAKLVKPVISRRPADLTAAGGGRVLFWPVTPLVISASDVRARLAAGRSARFLVPEPVRRLIEQRRLYLDSTVPPANAEGKYANSSTTTADR